MHATGCLSNLLDGSRWGRWGFNAFMYCAHPLTVSAQQTLFSRPLATMKTPSRFVDPTGTRLPAWRKLCHKLVSWPGFDSFIGMIILANGLTIGDLEISTLEPWKSWGFEIRYPTSTDLSSCSLLKVSKRF